MGLQAQTIDQRNQISLGKTAVRLTLQLKIFKRCDLIKGVRARFGPEHLLTVRCRLVLQADAVDMQLPGGQWQRARQHAKQGAFATPAAAAHQRDARHDVRRKVGKQHLPGILEVQPVRPHNC